MQQPTLDGFTPDETAQNEITDCFRYGWTAKKTGDAITFLVEGSCIAVQYRKSVKLPAPVALAVVDDDTEHAVRLDANFDETWGDKLELATLLEHGKEGRHIVTIRLAETHEDDAGSVLSGVRDCDGEKRKRLTAGTARFTEYACKSIAKSEKMLEDRERHCDCRSRRL